MNKLQTSPFKKIMLLGNVHVSNKRRGIFVPEEKRYDEEIKESRRDRLKFSSICINHKTRMEILNDYYSVEMEFGYVINPDFSNHQIFGCISL